LSSSGSSKQLASDPNYLANEQYRDASNLRARGQLHARFSINHYGWFRWYIEQLDLPDNARVLELGCGPGSLWSENRERIPADWELVLTDFSPGMLHEATVNLSDLGRQLRFERVDAQDIPFTEASFDAVLANHMLYHVPDRERAFLEIRRVLKPHGRLYAATNGEQHMREITQLVHASLPELNREEVFFSIHASGFTLENGAAQLARHFSQVRTLPYEDALRVTEVEPLLSYVLSSPISKSLSTKQVDRLRELLAKQMAEQGHIHISKASGVFEARRSH